MEKTKNQKLVLPESIVEKLYLVLQPLSLGLLIVGFVAPWTYGPLGKTGEWGWQPVWGLLLSLVGLNIFVLAAFASCFCYVELTYRLGHPVWQAVLKWLGGFFSLVIILPLVTWSLFNFSGPTRSPSQADGTPGWGVWLALLGLITEVAALRVRIWQLGRVKG